MTLRRSEPGRAACLVDRAMDFTVVPGFSRIGCAVRSRMFGWRDPDLAGRSVLITGSNSGIGEAAAVAMVAAGARVHMVVRNRERGEEARRRVIDAAASSSADGSAAHVPSLHICDVSDLDSVAEFARGWKASGETVDVLVHNAGVLPPERSRTDQGFELAFATNLLGPFLLTELLLPSLRESEDGLVVLVSSGGMYTASFEPDEERDRGLDSGDYSGVRAYARTKRAQVNIAAAWARREGEVRFASMHPGWVATPGVAGSLPGFDRVMRPLLRKSGEGADTIVWLARRESAGDGSGSFWHDRRERRTVRLPGTAGDTATQERLYSYLRALAEPWLSID